MSPHHRSRLHLNTVALGMHLKLDADELSLADELGRFLTTRAPIPPSGVLCAMSVVVGPTSRGASPHLTGIFETPHASVRAAGGSLSIPEFTRYHVVV